MDLTINGRRRQVSADPATSLLDVLRAELGLTGARFGCGEGQCGACWCSSTRRRLGHLG